MNRFSAIDRVGEDTVLKMLADAAKARAAGKKPVSNDDAERMARETMRAWHRAKRVSSTAAWQIREYAEAEGIFLTTEDFIAVADKEKVPA